MPSDCITGRQRGRRYVTGIWYEARSSATFTPATLPHHFLHYGLSSASAARNGRWRASSTLSINGSIIFHRTKARQAV